MKFPISETNIISCRGKECLRPIIISDNKIVQVRNFCYLGCRIGCERDNGVNTKLNGSQEIFGTI